MLLVVGWTSPKLREELLVLEATGNKVDKEYIPPKRTGAEAGCSKLFSVTVVDSPPLDLELGVVVNSLENPPPHMEQETVGADPAEVPSSKFSVELTCSSTPPMLAEASSTPPHIGPRAGSSALELPPQVMVGSLVAESPPQVAALSTASLSAAAAVAIR
jgi:hypothetical protein